MGGGARESASAGRVGTAGSVAEGAGLGAGRVSASREERRTGRADTGVNAGKDAEAGDAGCAKERKERCACILCSANVSQY